MMDVSRRWVAPTLIIALTILASALVLYTEHAPASLLVLIAASLVLVWMWIWPTAAMRLGRLIKPNLK
jgi:hypothetical protein